MPRADHAAQLRRHAPTPLPPQQVQWEGLGAWNYYFLGKLALTASGHLNFHLWPNLAFAAALLVPLPALLRGARLRWALRLRTLIAVPAGVSLLIKDTWFPPIARLLEQRGALQAFSFDYLVVLAGRFINWELLGVLFIAGVLSAFLSQWLRYTPLTVLGLAVMTVASAWPQPSARPTAAVTADTVTASSTNVSSEATLDTQLQQFFAEQARLKTRFAALPAEAEPFDILIMHICSLSWDDMDVAGMRDNALFAQMDVIFDQFNTATAYSGPASVRLLRASCGQPTHDALYTPASSDCYLFQNLAQLGFDVQLQLTNDDTYEGFLDRLKQQGMPDMTIPEQAFTSVPVMTTFYGKTLWSDQKVLDQWWAQRLRQPDARVALYYHSIALHDGNRLLRANGKSESAAYPPRLKTLFADVSAFIDTLQRSQRRVLLVLVPEHGYNLRGDKMQISGMRDVPSVRNTRVPVGVKLIGFGGAAQNVPIRVTEPSSFLAVSELVSRLTQQPHLSLDRGFTWSSVLRDLPALPLWVAENGAVTVIQQAQTAYVRLNAQNAWQEYPE